jgi:hypothetical protein
MKNDAFRYVHGVSKWPSYQAQTRLATAALFAALVKAL